jgi:hypothetical protein
MQSTALKRFNVLPTIAIFIIYDFVFKIYNERQQKNKDLFKPLHKTEKTEAKTRNFKKLKTFILNLFQILNPKF